jgi:hypothetical protein
MCGWDERETVDEAEELTIQAVVFKLWERGRDDDI